MPDKSGATAAAVLAALESALATNLAGFRQLLLADVDALVTRRLKEVVPTIATQKDGTAVSDRKRVLNFQGGGVTVSDNPTMGRTDIYVGGTTLTSTPTQLVISTTAAKALSLWNGSGNNTPPANWQTTGFNDAGWANALAVSGGGAATTISGASRLWPSQTPAAATEQTMFRHSFTVAAGTYQSVSLTIEADNFVDSVYLNGTLLGSATNGVPGSTLSNVTLSINPSLLITGTNVLAILGRNADPGAVTLNSAWVAYVINSTVVSMVSSSISSVSAALGADVAMTTANTYYDGPSVSLAAGTWLVIAYADVLASGQALMQLRITDGTTNYASGTAFLTGSGDGSVCVAAILTPGSTTSYKIQCAAQQPNATLKAATAANSSGNNATRILGIKIG